ncbi:MAG: aspartate aminotransferase family protein, partial [Planctomycetota bacterium]
LYGVHAVALLGHGHPRLVAAIRAQAERLVFYSNVVYSDIRARAVELLARLATEGLGHVFLANSGAEANEVALKIARKHTGGRPRIVAMREGFHGRTLGALSATGLETYRDPVLPLLPDHVFVPFGDRDALQAAVDDDTAAVLMEPIPSMGGVLEAPDAYFMGVRALCDDRGAMLVFDEVQTGFGRTGRLFYGEHVGVVPDLLTAAKGIAGGFPASCVFVGGSIASGIGRGEQGTTFGGGPLASAAIAAVARTLLEGDVVENARRVGQRLKGALAVVEGVEAVRGRGLLLGVDLDRPAGPIVSALREAGFLVGGSSRPAQIRLMPPLVLEEEDALTFPPALARVLARG